MTDHPLAALPPRGKDPFSASVLNNWIQHAATKAEIAPKRVARIVANGLVIAALQRVKHDDGDPVFAIKGGASLEVRLGLRARMSGDLDAVFRAEFDTLDTLDTLDEALAAGIGAFEFERGEAEAIPVKGRRVKPIRVPIRIMIKGKPALRVDLEVGPTEAGSGDGDRRDRTTRLAAHPHRPRSLDRTVRETRGRMCARWRPRRHRRVDQQLDRGDR